MVLFSGNMVDIFTREYLVLVAFMKTESNKMSILMSRHFKFKKIIFFIYILNHSNFLCHCLIKVQGEMDKLSSELSNFK